MASKCVMVAAFGGVLLLLAAVTEAAPGLEEALMQDGECSGGTEEECALSALQHRAKRVQVDEAPACALEAVGLVMQQEAAACVEACPQLCQASTALLAAATEGELHGGICQEPRLKCALQPEHAEVCRPLLKLFEESGRKVPLNLEDYTDFCAEAVTEAGTNLLQMEEEASVLKALVARAQAGDADARSVVLERSVAGKTANEFCKKAGEGQKCIPKKNGHSDSWIYCSAGKMLSAGLTQCSARVGRMSWCSKHNSVGLAREGCDDPFCRNGGAYGGNGNYCHKGSVVNCVGQHAPSVVDACGTRTHQDSFGCTITDYYVCAGRFPHPQCRFDSSQRQCTGGSTYGTGGTGGSAYGTGGSAYR